jgi:hypothetical protein
MAAVFTAFDIAALTTWQAATAVVIVGISLVYLALTHVARGRKKAGMA